MSEDLMHRAVRIAWGAHGGQLDKQGEPYIFHVMRVALSFAETSPDCRLVALLHDVVEDSEWTLDALRHNDMPAYVVEAVDALTRRKDDRETYAAYIQRLSTNSLAVAVKLADLRDNLRPERIGRLPADQAASLSKRYHAAWHTLVGLGG